MNYRNGGTGSYGRKARPTSTAGRRLPLGASALALAATFALGAGEAAAQGRCPTVPIAAIYVDGEPDRSTTPSLYESLLPDAAVTIGPTEEIYCGYVSSDDNNRGIVVHSPAITVVDDWVSGIEALHRGAGHLSVYVHAIDDWDPATTVSATFSHPHPLDLGQGISTRGDAAEYITGEESYGIYARHTGEGRVGIDVRNVSVHTDGDYAHGVYAWQEGSYRLRRNGGSTRARGAVVVNLIETDRDRESRIRPLVRTGGDYADAVRAEYTRAAAYGHVVVNVEGYTIATGGIVPLGVVGIPRQPGATPREPRRFAFDWTRPYVANEKYKPGDPNSPQYYNIRLREDLQQQLDAGNPEAVFQELGLNLIFPGASDGTGVLSGPIDIRPYTIVYLPVRNPNYDPEAGDSDSNKPYIDSPAAAVWNGRYFRALDESLATDVLSCQSMTTEADRTACIKEKITDKGRDSGHPTGFEARGIYASHGGHGDVRVRATDNVIRTWGTDAPGIYATHTGRTVTTPGEGGATVTTPGGGGVSITVTGGSIGTEGEESHGIWGRHRGDSGADSADGWVDPDDIGTGNVNIRVTDAAIATVGPHARGVYGLIQQTRVRTGADDDGNPTFDLVEGTGVGDIDIEVTGGEIRTQGKGRVWDVAEEEFKVVRAPAYAVQGRHENRGNVNIRMAGVTVATESDEAHGVFAEHHGSEGAVAVTVDGGSVTTKGERAHAVYALQSTDGGLTVRIANGATAATEGWGARGVNAVNNGDGDLTVELDGSVGTKGVPAVASFTDKDDPTKVNLRTLPMASVFVVQNGAGGLAFRMTGGEVTAEGDEAHGVQVVRTTAGGGSIDVAGGSVRAEGDDSVGVLAGFAGGGTGTVSVTVGEGASVTGDRFGIQLSLSAADDGNLPTSTVRVDGTVTGGSDAGIYLSHGGMVTVGRAGTVSASDSRTPIHAAAGDLSVTVAGTVEGDLRAPEGGALTFSSQAGGTVTGTVHDPAGPLTVAGSVGRLLYSSAATVTVAATGRMTGVAGESESIHAAAGDLSVTVAGTVAGDLRAPEGGALTFASQAGGTVTGTVHDPVGALTVAGKVGRLQYSSAATVTVAATGEMTGVAGQSESIHAAAGDLSVTVAGTVAGDLRAPEGGSLTFVSQRGSTVTGTVHDPAGPLTVAGSVGRLLYSNGGTVSVAATGKLTGVDIDGGREALRSLAGDLMATISGMVTGDVLGLGSGDHTVKVEEGGTVSGTVRLAASTATVDGAAGRVWLQNGGTVTVGATGRLTGVGGEAIRSDTGNLDMTLAGTVTGDVLALGTGRHRVTVAAGGTVSGTLQMATKPDREGTGSSVMIDGTVVRVVLNQGGAVTVGPNGRIPRGSHSTGGDIVVVGVPRPGESDAGVADRIGSATADRGQAQRWVDPPGEEPRLLVVEERPDDSPPEEPPPPEIFDDTGGIVPRARLYEALPMVLLELNEFSGFQDRMAVARDAQGSWARVESAGGRWKAKTSRTRELAPEASKVDLEYRYRRYGLQAGLDVPVGEDGMLGFSLHHRLGSVEVTNGGDVDPSGTGVGVSGAWLWGNDVYVATQAEATWLKADLTSGGVKVKDDVKGFGHVLAVEAGRRFASGVAGLAVIPRAGLVHSRVALDGGRRFEDAARYQVSMEDARSLKGHVGVGVETKLNASRLVGSLDVEHEFEDDAKVVMMSGTELKSTAKATALRLGLDGVHAREDGRYAVQGGVGYELSGSDNYELDARLSLKVRF